MWYFLSFECVSIIDWNSEKKRCRIKQSADISFLCNKGAAAYRIDTFKALKIAEIENGILRADDLC